MIRVDVPRSLLGVLKGEDIKVEVNRSEVIFRNGKIIGQGSLQREIDPQGLEVKLVFKGSELFLDFVLEEPVPEEPEELLKLSRYRAYMEVPKSFKVELLGRIRPLHIFFEKDGTPKTNFLLRAIEEYYPMARNGRFLAWWKIFKSVRDQIALKNTKIIHYVLHSMRVRTEEYEEAYQDCVVEFLRAVGMWDPDKGKLSTVAVPQLKAFLQRRFSKQGRFVSLDRPIAEGEHKSFIDFVYDPRTWDDNWGMLNLVSVEY